MDHFLMEHGLPRIDPATGEEWKATYRCTIDGEFHDMPESLLSIGNNSIKHNKKGQWRHEWVKGEDGSLGLACHLKEVKDGVNLDQCYTRRMISPSEIEILSQVHDPAGKVVNEGRRYFDKAPAYGFPRPFAELHR